MSVFRNILMIVDRNYVKICVCVTLKYRNRVIGIGDEYHSVGKII